MSNLPCVLCRFPEDTAKLRSDTACCTGCVRGEDCVCLDRRLSTRTRKRKP